MSLHRRSLTFFTPPPPPPPVLPLSTQPPPPRSSSTNLSPSFLIIAIILIFVFLVSASIHFLLRFLNRRCNAFSRDHDDVDVASNEPVHVPHISSRRVAPEDHQNKTLIDSLPLFSFNSLSALRSSPSADCAVCLSKFEPHDQLRLLPLCCHAFHSTCIDTWLASNHTCPLCRSTIHVHESDRYLKLLSSSSSSPPPPSSDSFRVEIGNVSSRRLPSDSGNRRSYSIGSFEYLVEDETTEIVVERKKDEPPPPLPLPLQAAAAAAANVPLAPGAELAEEVAGGGRGWLRDYVDRLAANSTTSSSISSRAVSFRCSGRFFTGSSRRSEGFTGSSRRSTNGSGRGGGGSWDLEGNQYGDEIGGFLRWLSGV